MPLNHIELDWYGDPVSFCCPVCGHAIYGQDSDETICSHVLFSYLDCAEGLENIRKDVRKNHAELIKKLEDGESEEGEVEDLIAALDYSSGVCFTITTSGMACGPCSYTLSVAVEWPLNMDEEYCEDEDDEEAGEED